MLPFIAFCTAFASACMTSCRASARARSVSQVRAQQPKKSCEENYTREAFFKNKKKAPRARKNALHHSVTLLLNERLRIIFLQYAHSQQAVIYSPLIMSAAACVKFQKISHACEQLKDRNIHMRVCTRPLCMLFISFT